jgi:hypothetical protein
MSAQQLNQTVDSIVEAPTAPHGLASWLRRHPLVGYFALAYTGTWLTLAPVVLSKSGVGALPWVDDQIADDRRSPALPACVDSDAGGGLYYACRARFWRSGVWWP